MVGILLVSHGLMADGIKDSVNLIFGDADAIGTAKLLAGQEFESLKEEVMEKIVELDQGKGVLVFVDLYGASPHNASILNYPLLQTKNVPIRVVTGMNLPMILETSAMRSYASLDEMAEAAINSGKDGIVEAVGALEAMSNEDEDGDY